MSASDAAESIRSGETVFVSGGALTPLEIGNAMGDLVGQRTGIRVMTYLPLAASRLYTAPEGTDTFSMEAIFYNGPLRKLDAAGMCLTPAAESVLPMARRFSRDLKGLTRLETALAEQLGVDKVCVAAGNADTDPHVLGEVGRIAGTRLRGFLQTGCTLAVTGGSTIREVAFAVPQGTPMNVMVVPARGGMGGALETQANTLACEIARRLGGHHRMMHLPDHLDEQALQEMRKLTEIDETLALLERADVVLHGVGRADDMTQRRQLPGPVSAEVLRKGAVAEAYGCYFDRRGRLVYSASTVAHNLGALKPDCAMIAVAAGAKKAEAIAAVMKSRRHAMLVTDEGAAKAILGEAP